MPQSDKPSTRPAELVIADVRINLQVVIERCRYERGDLFEHIYDALDELPHVFPQSGGADLIDPPDAAKVATDYLRERTEVAGV